MGAPRKAGTPSWGRGKGGQPPSGTLFLGCGGDQGGCVPPASVGPGWMHPLPREDPPWGVVGDQGVHPPSLGAVEGVDGLLPSSRGYGVGAEWEHPLPSRDPRGLGGIRGCTPKWGSPKAQTPGGSLIPTCPLVCSSRSSKPPRAAPAWLLPAAGGRGGGGGGEAAVPLCALSCPGPVPVLFRFTGPRPPPPCPTTTW